MQLRDVLNLSVSHTLVWVYTLLWIACFAQTKPPDVHVTCIYSTDCILPCSFTPSDDKVDIQWFQQEKLILRYQEDEEEPDEGSLSLFPDEVSDGNASLLLRDSRIQSRGRYRCSVNTTQTVQESFVIVKVEAPISRISLEAGPTGQLQCSSQGLYPAPVLMWSTEPSVGSLKVLTRMNPDANGLYSLESTLQSVNTSSPLTYTCTVTPKYGSQVWRASLLQTELVGKADRDLVIPCMAPKNLKNFTLTWTFTKKNKKKDILTYYSRTHRIDKHWEDHAELDLEKARTGDGSLYLEDWEISKHSGKYTCTISGPQVTYTVQTSVSASTSSPLPRRETSKSKLWVIAVVMAALAVFGVLFYLYRKYIGPPKKPGEDTEMQAVQKDKPADELPAELKPLNSKEGGP